MTCKEKSEGQRQVTTCRGNLFNLSIQVKTALLNFTGISNSKRIGEGDE